jgi:hypothetical protein
MAERAERDSGWISGGVVDAEDARLATGVLAAPGAGPIQSRSGIRPADGNPGQVRALSTPSKEVTVQPFQAVIQGTRATAAGPYLATLDTVKTVDVLASGPADSSNERRDLIVARQFDPQYGDNRTGMVVERVQGQPAATPTDPVVPGDHLKLARVRVRAGTTTITANDLTDLRTFTGAVGGVLLARNATDRPVNPYQGLYVHRLDTNRLEMWTGAAWRALLVEDDTGWVDVPVGADWAGTSPAPDDDGPAIRVRRLGRLVHLRGGATRRNTPAPHGTLIFTLPAEFRPRYAHHWVAPTWAGKQYGWPQYYELGAYADGRVVLWAEEASMPVNETVFVHTTWLLEA